MFSNVLWLSGMPRSGTNWMSQILASSPEIRMKFCPLFSYEFKNSRDESSTSDEWQHLFEAVFETQSEYLDQEYLRKDGHVPSFQHKSTNPSILGIKSTRFHNLTEGILQKCANVRYIGLVRHPAAAIHSWITNPLEFPRSAKVEEEWRTGRCRKTSPGEFWGFNDWIQTTRLYLRLQHDYPDRFRLVRYEDLVREPQRQIEQLFEWNAIEVTDQTLNFIRASQTHTSQHKRSVFKDPAVSNAWRKEIDPAIFDEIMATLQNTDLEPFTQE